MPYARGDGLARPWIKPGTPGLEHRIGGIEKAPGTGNIDYSPAAHQEMTDTRHAKVAGVANSIPDQPVCLGREGAALAVVGWGSTFGPIHQAVRRALAEGKDVAHVHVRHIWPMPKNMSDLLRGFEHILVPEMNMGQFKTVLRDQFLVDAQSLTKVSGHPFRIAEIEAAIDAQLGVDHARERQLPRRPIDETDQRFPDADAANCRGPADRLAGWIFPMNEMTKVATTAKDWASDQEVRWCPGCGDYAVLKAVQRTMPELGLAREKTVFVSGIGCSSRFPYYMASYGFHTIHGRAPAFATGIKLANPELDVWIITGDGDALSIGGNHTMHILRRNLDCQILLFNNEIYGLTKGQYSPTSHVGTRSPSTPFGSVDRPVTPCMYALGSGARFIARGIDVHKNLPDVLKAAHAHRGASFVEIYQNCVVYNDDVFASFTERSVAAEKQLWLKAGEKMRFGGGAKGIALDIENLRLKVVEGDDPAVIVHDPKNTGFAAMLIERPPSFAVALGVIYSDPGPTFESAVIEQNQAAASGKQADLQALVSKGQTWQVEKEPRAE